MRSEFCGLTEKALANHANVTTRTIRNWGRDNPKRYWQTVLEIEQDELFLTDFLLKKNNIDLLEFIFGTKEEYETAKMIMAKGKKLEDFLKIEESIEILKGDG